MEWPISRLLMWLVKLNTTKEWIRIGKINTRTAFYLKLNTEASYLQSRNWQKQSFSPQNYIVGLWRDNLPMITHRLTKSFSAFACLKDFNNTASSWKKPTPLLGSYSDTRQILHHQRARISSFIFTGEMIRNRGCYIRCGFWFPSFHQHYIQCVTITALLRILNQIIWNDLGFKLRNWTWWE